MKFTIFDIKNHLKKTVEIIVFIAELCMMMHVMNKPDEIR